MILIKTKKTIIILIVLSVILIVSYYFLFININKKSSDIYTMSQKIKDTQIKKDNFLSMQKNLSVSEDKLTELKGFILKAGDEIGFIKKIEGFASLSNTKLEVKTAKTEQISGKGAAMAENFRIGLDATGSFSNVFYLLNLIENMPFKVTINSVSFDKFANLEAKVQTVPQWILSVDFSVIKEKQI